MDKDWCDHSCVMHALAENSLLAVSQLVSGRKCDTSPSQHLSVNIFCVYAVINGHLGVFSTTTACNYIRACFDYVCVYFSLCRSCDSGQLWQNILLLLLRTLSALLLYSGYYFFISQAAQYLRWQSLRWSAKHVSCLLLL